jgi:hypothetical protein
LQSFVVEAARYRLGLSDLRSFRRLARGLLLDGRDVGVPLLLLRDASSERTRVVFERVCASVGQTIPGREDAVVVIMTAICHGVDQGSSTPARAITLMTELRDFCEKRGLPSLTKDLGPGPRAGESEISDAMEGDVRRFARDWVAAHPDTLSEILRTRCGFPIDADWARLAAERGTGEDRLIARYRRELFGGDAPADEHKRTQDTPWGPGVPFHEGMIVTAIRRRGAWPETQMVLDLFWTNLPDRQCVLMLGIWPPGRIREPEPPYNRVFWFNLLEEMHTRAGRVLHKQAGPVAYYIGGISYAVDPPALGRPPAELLRARDEVQEIQRGWGRRA